MQEIAFFKARPFLREHVGYTSVKGQKPRDEILHSRKTGNLETLSLPIVLLSITTPGPNQQGRTERRIVTHTHTQKKSESLMWLAVNFNGEKIRLDHIRLLQINNRL